MNEVSDYFTVLFVCFHICMYVYVVNEYVKRNVSFLLNFIEWSRTPVGAGE